MTQQNHSGIQMTLLDYFKDVEEFTLTEATECVQKAKAEINAPVKVPSIRARIYEGIDKGLFKRVSKGVYTVTNKGKNNEDITAMLINGDGRDLSMFADNSIDAIITDHPYDLSKSLNGGNRHFAEYDRFKYTESDFKEKARVLKPGHFLVEFLPEENAENYEYLYEIKTYAKKNGLEYYAKVAWKKGDFVANTGRKAKNTEDIVFFTKGKCRELKLDAKKNKAMFADMTIFVFDKSWTGIAGNGTGLNLLINKKDETTIREESKKAYDNRMYEECDNSILLTDKKDKNALLQMSVREYILTWLKVKNLEYIDITDNSKNLNNADLTKSNTVNELSRILLDVAPEKLHYMKGTNGMLPTIFDVAPVPKSERIHQAEKPVELLEQIIGFITTPSQNEKLLDQFAGSGSLGEAALNTGNDSILIEKDSETFNKAAKRLHNRHR